MTAEGTIPRLRRSGQRVRGYRVFQESPESIVEEAPLQIRNRQNIK